MSSLRLHTTKKAKSGLDSWVGFSTLEIPGRGKSFEIGLFFIKLNSDATIKYLYLFIVSSSYVILYHSPFFSPLIFDSEIILAPKLFLNHLVLVNEKAIVVRSSEKIYMYI